MSATRTSKSSISIFQHVLLIAITIICLPASILALFYNNAALVLIPQNTLRRSVQRSPRFRQRKVLITGISTPPGLKTARALWYTGHKVVGVDQGRYTFLNHARWSKAVSKLYLSWPSRGDSKYAEDLFRVIVKERAAIWIDCSIGQSSRAYALAKRLVEERTTCLCLVPSMDQIRQLEDQHNFRQLAEKLGLPCMEAHSVSSRNDVYNVLTASKGKRYMLSSPNGTSEPRTTTIIPRRTISQTYGDVSKLQLSKGTPWTMQQYTEGMSQFAACAVVIRGQIQAFAATSLSGEGVHVAVLAKSGIHEAMKQYLTSFANEMGPGFSSHLTMQFCVEENATKAGVVQQIFAVSGHALAQDSLLLFDGKRGSINLTKAYMSILSTTTTELEAHTGLPYHDSNSEVLASGDSEIGVYLLSRDLENLVVDPLLRLMTLREGISSVARSWVMFLHHLVSWQEALYDFGDPLPLFWNIHVSTPCQLVLDVAHKAWSGISSRRWTSRRTKHGRKEVQNGIR